MKHIHLDGSDGSSVDVEMSVPEQSLRDLICITEKSIMALAGQMNAMTKDIERMREVMELQLPAIVHEVGKLIVAMNNNTQEGMKKTDELIAALKGVSDGNDD